jgi:glycosyltransferase involved in cell wall biosynthesis
MDVCILPSAQPEPFGGVVMEAMALGIPVIGTKIGGTVEQIEDGKTGFLVPPADPQAIAAAVAKLASAPERRRQMGLDGRKRVADQFNIGAMTTRIVAAYESLLC